MELNSIEKIIIIASAAATGLTGSSLFLGEQNYQQAKKEYDQLDDRFKTEIRKPTRRENYLTAVKATLALYSPSKSVSIIENSNSGKIGDAFIKQKMQKAAWGENYELMPKQ